MAGNKKSFPLRIDPEVYAMPWKDGRRTNYAASTPKLSTFYVKP